MTEIVLVVAAVAITFAAIGWYARGYRDSLRLTPAIKHAAARKPATLDRPTRQRLARDERLGLATGRRNERTRSSS